MSRQSQWDPLADPRLARLRSQTAQRVRTPSAEVAEPDCESATVPTKTRGHVSGLRRVMAAGGIVLALASGVVGGNHLRGDPWGWDPTINAAAGATAEAASDLYEAIAAAVAEQNQPAGSHRLPTRPNTGIVQINIRDYANRPTPLQSDPPAPNVPVADPTFSNRGNGAVQTHPTVTLVFWGSQWSGHENVMATVIAAYAHMEGSPFAKNLQQYDGAARHVTLAGVWVDSTPPAGTQVGLAEGQAEVARFGKVTGQTFDASSQLILLMPPGVVVDPAISPGKLPEGMFIGGFHSATANGAPFAVVRWTDGYLCQPQMHACDSAAGIVTDTSLHESAEAAIDPLGTSFSDSAGQEVADICETLPGQIGRRGIPVPYIYSARDQACVAAPIDGH